MNTMSVWLYHAYQIMGEHIFIYHSFTSLFKTFVWKKFKKIEIE